MLKDTAAENLAAGDLLLERGLVNASASRYYYAMYQIAVHRLIGQGRRPGQVRSGAVDWDHSMVENNIRMLRNDPRDRLLYKEMRRLRVEADYTDAGVRESKVRACRDSVTDFVKELAR